METIPTGQYLNLELAWPRFQLDRLEIGPEGQLRLAELPQVLHEYDAVVSCTASSLPIIGLGAVERALKTRRITGFAADNSRVRAMMGPASSLM